MSNSSLQTWKCVETLSENLTREQFLNAIKIWNNNPRSVNHRIHSCIPLLSEKLSDNFDIDLLWPSISSQNLVSELEKGQFGKLGLPFCDDSSSIQVFVKKLLPKSPKHHSITFELVIVDSLNAWAFFVGFYNQDGMSLVPKFPYKLCHRENVTLEVLSGQDESEPSLIWLKQQLLPQLQKWGRSQPVDDSEGCNTGLPRESHTLISAEKYAQVYQTLKEKYGQQMVKIWPECTDPAKYVFEDVAIASYILLLWGDEKPVSYVDLGCGNGLLVHILNSEGHQGLGIDVRRRKIWDLYPETTKLQVSSITPSDDSLFPKADWLIGNHSDELTPWIPVMAARSSQTCNFFLLPCCPYDFDGLKFRRKDSNLSQYADFLMYVKQISEESGFETHIDRMRIPSTKRICLVGRRRTYDADEWTSVKTRINKLIVDGCRRSVELEKNVSDVHCDNEWVANFKPREATERVRNCTQLEEQLVQEIVSLTAEHLLAKRRLLPHPTQPNRNWNAGGHATLAEIVPLIGASKLRQLKNECGGLQTLLKNHHQVFRVEKGQVSLRTPIRLSETVKNDKIKVKCKPCWFFHHHPDGCMLEDSDCAFKH